MSSLTLLYSGFRSLGSVLFSCTSWLHVCHNRGQYENLNQFTKSLFVPFHAETDCKIFVVVIPKQSWANSSLPKLPLDGT